MNWTTTQDQKLQYIRALVYGESGRGKTTSLGTLSESSTAIIVAGERGALPLRNRNYKAITVSSWDEMMDAAMEMKDGIPGIKTVCLDSLSALADMLKRGIVQNERKALIKSRTRGRSETPDGIYDDLMTQEDWGLYLARIKGLLSILSNCPFHLVVTALAGWHLDKRSGLTKKIPALQGRIALEVSQFFDLVFYMDIHQQGDKDFRVWRTASDTEIEAKDATGILKPMEAPNWAAVFSKILPPPPTTKTENDNAKS